VRRIPNDYNAPRAPPSLTLAPSPAYSDAVARVITRKLYCYVDESGQDALSRKFVVVAVVVPANLRDTYGEHVRKLEGGASTFGLKWHKTRSDRRIALLESVAKRGIGQGQTYLGLFDKPTPYFLPMVDTIERGITHASEGKRSHAIVLVDGIDRKKSLELTNGLRSRGVRLNYVRSARDESEPLIRLADMWAGCARAAFLGQAQAKRLLDQGVTSGHLVIVAPKKPQ
jgi:hypothetical protein